MVVEVGVWWCSAVVVGEAACLFVRSDGRRAHRHASRVSLLLIGLLPLALLLL